MSPETIQLVSSGGAGVAVIAVTLVFLRYLRGEREQLMEDRREERSEFLSKLEQTSDSLCELTRALSRRPCMLWKEGEREPETLGERAEIDRG